MTEGVKFRACAAAICVTFAAGCGYVTGQVDVVGPPQPDYFFSVKVSALSGIGGTVEATQPGPNWIVGPVTCLAVSGKRATIGVKTDRYPPGGLIFVEDNGSPVDGVGVDVVNATYVYEVPTTCVAPTDAQLDVFPLEPGLEPVYAGDVTVGVVGVTTSTPSGGATARE
jgi:hypothetical protein